MKRKLHALFFFLLCFITLPGIYSQEIKSFSTDPVVFAAEVESFFIKYPPADRQAGQLLVSNFKQALNAGVFTSAQQQAMIEIANQMLEHGFRPQPHFMTYFSAILGYQHISDNPAGLMAWFKSLPLMFSKANKRQLQLYLEFSNQFFRKGILCQANGVEWKTIGGEWLFAVDTVPVLRLKNVNLRCMATRDSMIIAEASGVYYPVNELWVGNQGRVNWMNDSVITSNTYAKLLRYQISMRTSAYTADSAHLFFPRFFNYPLPGTLSDRAAVGNPSLGYTYPRFISFRNNLFINNVFPNIDFQGGFAIEGNRIVGFGNKSSNATCIIKRKNIAVARLSAQSFVIRDDRISSQRAAFSLFALNDSIYHPGLQLRYTASTNELILLRGDEGIAQSPFFNTFHKVDMYFDGFYWKLDANNIEIGSFRGLQRQSEAVFESSFMFLPEKYYLLQGIDKVHPAIVVNNFMRNRQSMMFFHEELASYMKIELAQVVGMLINLAAQGFILYDPETGRAIVKDRLRHYINAINKKADYDVIKILSRVDGQVNATLNLNNFDLTIRGVPELNLSNSQKVHVYPERSEIVLKRNLDFTFSGKIDAGYFEFYASQCAFQYDVFKLSLAVIDSVAFSVPVPAKDKLQKDRVERIKTVLSNISGELLINHPNNKSGRVDLAEYPKFSSTTESYVFFNQQYIQQGVYKKDNFYYHVLPFTIDSLSSFTTVGIEFRGSLYSGGLLPDINEPLKVQPDYSLGLSYKMPPRGMPLYNGKGQAFVDLSMSQQGLRGKGRVVYLESESWSKDFLFHPDSMMAVLDEFKLKESQGNPSMPSVMAKNISQRWLVIEEEIILQSVKNEPFNIYGQQVAFRGKLALRPDGLLGNGSVDMDIAQSNSNKFYFRYNSFGSEAASFKINTTSTESVFSANQISFSYDTELRQGNFILVKPGSFVSFPQNEYICNLPSIRWEVDYKEMYLASDIVLPDSPSRSSVFISTHPRQDSLQFAASSAYFDMHDNVLKIESVPLFRVADAEIIPIDGKVVIHPKAAMKPLQGANIIASQKTRYHSFYNATVDIKSRKSYSATGVYDFVNNQDQVQTIFFNDIGVDTSGFTYGQATIKETSFPLSNYFDFSGSIRLSAAKKPFYFDGGYRIKHTCLEGERKWVQFQGEVNSQDVVLPVPDKLKEVGGANLSASVLFSLSSAKIYNAFLEKKELPGDHGILQASGSIRFNDATNRYIISGDNAGPGAGTKEPQLSFDIFRCHVSGWGIMDLGADFGQLKMKTAGGIDHFVLNDSTILQLFAALDFFFAENALQLMANKINSFNLPGVDLRGSLPLLGITMISDAESARQWLNELSLYGSIRRLPDGLSHSLIMSDLKLFWNKSTRSYTSVGSMGVALVNKQLVSKSVPGHIEIARRRTGDMLNIYLEPDRNEWYFFSYSNGVMQAISSNNDFNNILLKLKEDRRKLKTKDSEEPYQFIISTQQTRNAFLRRMRSN